MHVLRFLRGEICSCWKKATCPVPGTLKYCKVRCTVVATRSFYACVLAEVEHGAQYLLLSELHETSLCTYFKCHADAGVAKGTSLRRMSADQPRSVGKVEVPSLRLCECQQLSLLRFWTQTWKVDRIGVGCTRSDAC